MLTSKGRVTAMVAGFLLVGLGSAGLSMIEPTWADPKSWLGFLYLVPVLFGVTVFCLGASDLFRRRVVHLDRLSLVIRDRRAPFLWRERRLPLSLYRGIAIQPLDAEAFAAGKPCRHLVVLAHAREKNSVVLLDSADELAALRYQKQAARALKLPLIESDRQVRDAPVVDDPIDRRIAQGGIAFDATPEPPPGDCFAGQDGDAFLIVSRKGPYEHGLKSLTRHWLRREPDPDAAAWRLPVFWLARRLGALVLVLMFLLGWERFLGFAATYGVFALLGLFAVLFGAFAVLRRMTRDRRDFLRISPDGIAVGTMTLQEETVSGAVDRRDVEAVQLGSESGRPSGLYVVGRERILRFGADLSPSALAWSKRALLAHLSRGPDREAA